MQSMTERFEEQLPEILRVLEAALRGGNSLQQSFEAVVRDIPNPVAEQVCLLIQETESGVAQEQALDHLLARVPSGDLDLVVAVLKVQREIGGNLADKLNLIGHVIRTRKKI